MKDEICPHVSARSQGPDGEAWCPLCDSAVRVIDGKWRQVETFMSSPTVSDPSAGPRDRFNALAKTLVEGMVDPDDGRKNDLAFASVVKALQDVYWEGHREGDREAKAT